jgi:transcriptional regulator GlxA family with amidase domain
MYPRRQVVFLLHEGFESVDLSGPATVFSGARTRTGAPAYAVHTLSRLGQPARSAQGFAVDVAGPPNAIQGRIDTLVVPGGFAVPQAAKDTALLHELRKLAARSRRVASVCSGSQLLAAAGLLDGRRATSHWADTDDLRRRHPKIDVVDNVVWVRDGDVYTSAGVTTGIDLALALVEDDLGAHEAGLIARWMVVFARRPGGQSQSSVRASLPQPRSTRLTHALDAAVEDPAADLSIEALASRAAMSVRHFARVFGDEMGLTPARYVERIRVEAAQQHLEASQATLDVVATASGFRNVETMRRAFHRVLGTSPGRYRARTGARSP